MTERDRTALGTAIGLAAKAGKLVYGTPMICDALAGKGKKTVLVLEASDTSENTRKRLNDKCLFYNIMLTTVPLDMEELSSSVGKKSLIAAVAVCDEGLAKVILAKLKTADVPSEGAN